MLQFCKLNIWLEILCERMWFLSVLLLCVCSGTNLFSSEEDCRYYFIEKNHPLTFEDFSMDQIETLRKNLGPGSEMNADILPPIFEISEEVANEILDVQNLISQKKLYVTFRRKIQNHEFQPAFYLDSTYSSIGKEIEEAIYKLPIDIFLPIGFWIEKNLNKALSPEEKKVFFSSFMIRRIGLPDEIANEALDCHVDLGAVYFNSTLTLRGLGTNYWRHSMARTEKPYSTPKGKVFLFSGLGRQFTHERLLATRHGSPQNG